MPKYTGACACGAVTVKTDADPMMAGHCQCSKCQTLAGAGHSTFAAFPEPAVTVSGPLTSWTYIADSGHTATRNRCTTCGTQMTSGTTGMPAVVALNLTTLQDPNAIKPAMVFFHDKALAWDTLDPALPTFPGMPQM